MFEIVWSKTASDSLKKILEFWIEHNLSKTYSEKIANAIVESEGLLKERPFMGSKTNFQNVRRILILQNFSIFYKVEKKKKLVKIIAFRDNRRKPKY